MMFDHVMQTNRNNCGHAVISMITGIDIGEVMLEIGDRKLYPKDIRLFLQEHGFNMEKRSSCRLPDRPDCPAVMFGNIIKKWTLRGHFMLWDGEKFLDPDRLNPFYYLSPRWHGRFYRVEETA